ncbi:RrF2 family transcriptional regulator [Sphingomonas sp. PR090111-T3T-6A]|uniref:RrF2 family transcriptional regulator n=1 Tax=Sphingomonas sp. PR090111-T3T-6A TaxID=685778 RepID=UPI0003A35B98|nr:Rrf2 family transcriptional regulator [Sphingomonas sp. PR090111-T3T-6A]
MTHITTGVEYALHCLLFLVDTDEEQPLASARDLAELQGVPADFVAKLFTKLQKAGIVAATEGVRGGFRLARAPERISVLDIVEAIDGQKPLFECRNIRSQCALFEGEAPGWATRGVCSIHAVMLEAEARIRDVMASHTLASLATQVASKTPPEYLRKTLGWLADRAPARTVRAPR